MSQVLIVYGTTQGQTGKIAACIKSELQKDGHSVELFDCGVISDLIDPKIFDAVIVGASVHAGVYQRRLKRWVNTWVNELNSRPSAFFSVCLGVLQSEESVQREELKIVDEFLQSSHWRPAIRVIFAGALCYSQYNPLLKWQMKRISKKAGGDTDTSKDYEYTDWSEVCRFAKEFSNALGEHFPKTTVDSKCQAGLAARNT